MTASMRTVGAKRGKKIDERILHMRKRVAYYQGCSLEGLASEFDASTRLVCEALGVELVEIPDWNCCGSSPAHSYDSLLSAALAGRNLAIAEEMGCDTVMTPCPGCLKALKGALEEFHGKRRDDLLHILGMPFHGSMRAVSVLQLLYEDVGLEAIKERVQRPLTDMVIVPYYGCILTRPAGFAKFDDPENPLSMDGLLRVTGATVPEFPYKTECCGATNGITRNGVVGRLTGRILDMALRLGAQAVATACPLCQQNLDLRRHQVDRYQKRSFNIPAPYITQLIGLALGLNPEELGMGKLFVSPRPLLQRLEEGCRPSVDDPGKAS